MNELLPDYPLSLYAAFPAEIRPLLQRSDIEDAMCRDGGWLGAQGLLACNRRYDVQLAIERRGWCYSRPAGTRDGTWVPCRDYPHYRPGYLEAEGPPKSAFDIAWVDDQDRRARGQAGSPELPALMRQLWREAEQGLATPAEGADMRAFPLERYRGYPPAIRPLLQRVEIEDRNCRVESVAGGSDALRACNRKAYAEIALERSGWCQRGGAWQRCRDDPDYLLGQVALFNHINPASLIHWTAERERQESSRLARRHVR